jgi:hypothetical protein
LNSPAPLRLTVVEVEFAVPLAGENAVTADAGAPMPKSTTSKFKPGAMRVIVPSVPCAVKV